MNELYRSWLISFYTIFSKELKRFLRIWLQTLIPPAITMALYFVIFGGVIGSRVGTMEGHDYVSYIAPGTVSYTHLTLPTNREV